MDKPDGNKERLIEKQDSQVDKRRNKHDTNTGTAVQTGTDWNAKRNRNTGIAIQTGTDCNAKRNRNTGIAIQTGTDWNAKRNRNTSKAVQTGTDWNAKRNRNIGIAVQTGTDWNAKRNRNTGIAIQTGTDWNAKSAHYYTDLAKTHYGKASQKQEATLIESPDQNGLPSCRTFRVIRVSDRQRISFFPVVELPLTPRSLVASLQSETRRCCKLAHKTQV